MVGFNYRRLPALALARQLVDQGRIGTLRHFRAAYLQDWLADPDAPMTWRMQAERAGSSHAEALASQERASHVRILTPQHRSKKTNRRNIVELGTSMNESTSDKVHYTNIF